MIVAKRKSLASQELPNCWELYTLQHMDFTQTNVVSKTYSDS